MIQNQTSFEWQEQSHSGSVECLGRTFVSEAARRTYYLDILREKLKDPAFRQIEGFPIADDEDILALSDPPYYTACPNPFIEDFFRCYGKPFAKDKREYQREPFAADVSEGKSDPIYNAHSYHTKVPHKAIMRYILHYTEPGDLVFDGFCGTGMTGVAAQLCGDKATVESLGYLVRDDGTILNEEGQPFSRLGARRAILNDLSPAATFIAYNYNTPVNIPVFEREARRILKLFETKYGWMYETKHTEGDIKGRINYTVWSDVFYCNNCQGEIIFWSDAVEAGEVKDEITCPHCKAFVTKATLQRATVTVLDPITQQTITKPRRKPMVINYSVSGVKYEKVPDEADLAVIEKIENEPVPGWFPTDRIDKDIDLWYERDYRSLGVFSIDAFFSRRSLIMIAFFRQEIFKAEGRIKGFLWFWFQSVLMGFSLLNRYRKMGFSQVNQLLSGTLYIGAVLAEISPWYALEGKIRRLGVFSSINSYYSIVSTNSSALLTVPSNSQDYIFLDPPFGSNLIYSDLSIIWEAWLKIKTATEDEAVVHRRKKTDNLDLDGYRDLMASCFKEACRVLKPGRWMTVEFSNTQASVWNAIQLALQEAGFVVANVSALDKQQVSFKAVTTTTAVKQDLVISAYKPNGGLEERFERLADSEEGVWQFISSHLRYLPTVIARKGELQPIAERDPRILYDRMVAYYVQHLRPVPVSSREFQEGLRQRFPERDGMYFLPEQVVEYDRKRLQSKQIGQQSMFVDDERSAIFWLQNFLKERPSTYQEIQPEFLKQLGAGWKKYEARPELLSLLEDNFLRYEGVGEVPPQIHSYLSSNYHELRNLAKDAQALRAKARERWYVPDPSRAEDLEKKRENHLLREFEQYRQATGRKLKVFRLEALRAGFRQAWQRGDYALIVEVGRKLPDNVLQEDEKLLLWYDQSQLRQAQSGKNR